MGTLAFYVGVLSSGNVPGPVKSPRLFAPPPVCCQPQSASPLQISSTGAPYSPFTLEWAHIGCKRAASPSASTQFSKPAQICHSLQLFFCNHQLWQSSVCLQMGCFSVWWTHAAINDLTTAAHTGLKVIARAVITLCQNPLTDMDSGTLRSYWKYLVFGSDKSNSTASEHCRLVESNVQRRTKSSSIIIPLNVAPVHLAPLRNPGPALDMKWFKKSQIQKHHKNVLKLHTQMACHY